MYVCCRYSSTYNWLSYIIFFFFKQKTAYEMRISDWSSDVCSSDLLARNASLPVPHPEHGDHLGKATSLCRPTTAIRPANVSPPLEYGDQLFRKANRCFSHSSGASLNTVTTGCSGSPDRVSGDRKSTRLNSST